MEEQNPKQTKAILLGGAALLLAVFLMIRYSGTFYAQTANISITLAVILGFAAGLFLSRRFAAIRAYFFILCLIAAGLFVAFAAPQGAPPILFILTFLSGLAFGYIEWKKAKRTEFGSAEWATIEHLQENGLIGAKGLLLGFFPTNEGLKPIHYEGDRHGLVVAPTRSGKGTTFLIPNLLTAQNSCVIIDPKGENATITYWRRGQGNEKLNIKGMGQQVHVVDPWGITDFTSSRFNPLDWLQPDDIDLNENAMILADSMITPNASSNDTFWDEEAKALLMGILLYVALVEEENRHLGRVRDIISLGEKDMNRILGEMEQSDNIVVQSAGTRTLSKEERVRSSVLASLQAHTHFLDSPRMRENLKTSDFCFGDLKTEPTTIYLVLPADRLDTFGRWLRLMIQQALTINARNIEKKPERPILFMLDEMANLGRLKMVETAYSLMAGFGVQLLGIVQDVGQLERIYGKGWQTFVGNSGVIQYYGSRDYQTADYFSKLCGVTTIEKFSFSQSIANAISSASGKQSGTSSTTQTSGHTKDVAQRQLAYADELMNMQGARQIVFIENFNPISAVKIPWFKDEILSGFGVNLYPEKAPLLETPPQDTEPIPPEPISEEAPNRENFLAEKVVELAKNIEKTVKNEDFKDRVKKAKGQIIKKGNALLDKAKEIKQEKQRPKSQPNFTEPKVILEDEHQPVEQATQQAPFPIEPIVKKDDEIRDLWDTSVDGMGFWMDVENMGYKLVRNEHHKLCILSEFGEISILHERLEITPKALKKRINIDVKALPMA